MVSMKKIMVGIMLVCLPVLGFAFINMVNVKMYETAKVGHGPFVGTVTFLDSPKGLLIQPNLANLTPGPHGFHLHENASCNDMGMAAGGHYDPQKTGKHLGPVTKGGHLGDMPVLVVGKNGMAVTPVIAPHLKVADLKGHAIMLHEHGDNYKDTPAPNGGGGARIACGVVN